MSIRLDLHTHSVYSPDGGLTAQDYRQIFTSKKLQYVAITDHGNVFGAQQIAAQIPEFAANIIIGEEIMTQDGELIGLYLVSQVAQGMSLKDTVSAIKGQGGLVYVPHPFETVRHGISQGGMDSIIQDVDIIETSNGRAVFQNRGVEAARWADKYHIAQAASSDAHGRRGWGRTFSVVGEAPSRGNLVDILKHAEFQKLTVGIGIIYPKINRLKKRVSK